MNEFRCQESGPDEVTCYVHGIIGGDVMGSELGRVIDEERKRKTRCLVFDIYSPGGSVWEGNLIAAKMREAAEAGIETRAKVYAAASMATVLAVSCDRVEIAANGRWLVHNPWTVTIGDAAAMDKAAQELRDCEAEAASLYATVTGRSVEDVTALMAEERWLTPAETLEWGFADAIIPGTDPAAYAEPRTAVLSAAGVPAMVAKLFAEEPAADVPPADDHADLVQTEGTTAGPAGAADAEPAAEIEAEDVVAASEYEAVSQRLVELTAEAKTLTGQVMALRAEVDRKETVIQDLNRRLKALSPATAGTDEDRAATAGQGDPQAFWKHVETLRAEGMEHEAALLEAAKRWPDDHRALIRKYTRK